MTNHRLFMVAACCAALWGGPASALEEIGVYFDASAYRYCEWLPMPAYQPVPIYFTLTGVTAPVQGFEFSYKVTNPDQFYRLSSSVGGIGPEDTGDHAGNGSGWYRVMWPSPPPAGDRLVLVTWSMMSIAWPTRNFAFGLGAAPDPWLPGVLPVVQGGEGYGLRRVPIHADWYGGYTAWFGGCEVLPTETTSFGAIKALYR